MIKISQAVQNILAADELAQEALAENLLSLSAYADKIHKQVEKLTFKEVKRGSIVVALSRLAEKKRFAPPLKPEVKIADISVRGSLTVLTYPKTADTQRKLHTMQPFKVAATDIFAVTEGNSQISIAAANKSVKVVTEHMGKPKKELENLSAVTAEFAKDYSQIPNVLYVLFSALGAKRINILGIICTESEISFIVEKTAMEQVIASLNGFSK
ncbi:hypothetical protein HY024_03590 [Candidatus Curtissbacteria bacterium]|nr:hypothetical protein [Candidatus Curtissbacteria bacterium]